MTFPLEHPVVEDKLLAAWGVRFLQIKNYFALYAKSDRVSILRAGVSLV